MGETPGRDARSQGDEILGRSSSYFQRLLWGSEVGTRVRSRLSRSGIDEPILRAFRVGYAPGDTRRLLAHLAEWGYTPEELIAAGLASRSERSRMHVVFHGRIMFPISNVDGGILGFAGLATHLGPSWPMWLTSADQGPFDAGTAIFGISQAAPEIARARRALVLRDCVQVLALHAHR
jgi:DNA primase